MDRSIDAMMIALDATETALQRHDKFRGPGRYDPQSKPCTCGAGQQLVAFRESYSDGGFRLWQCIRCGHKHSDYLEG